MNLPKNLSHYGDLFAIPFFFITFMYFYRIENKTPLENLIMLFIIICLVGDIFFTALFFTCGL